MKRKLAIMALAAAMVVSNAAAPMTSMTVCAAENDEIGDILDDMFGGNKPPLTGEGTQGGGSAPGEEWGGWQPSEEAPAQDDNDQNDNGSDNGGSDTGDTGEQGGGNEQQPSQPSGGSDSKDEIGDILDDMFGGNKPPLTGEGTQGGGISEEEGANSGWQPSIPGWGGSDQGGSSNTGNTGSTDNSGSSDSGSDSSSSASTGGNASTDTYVQVVDPATGSTVTVVEQAGTTTAVPVTDEATLAVLPEAMIVTAPSGLSFVHSLDASRMVYCVWGAGTLSNTFMIVDGAGTPVVMQDVALVTAPDGKTYVNVTIDPAVTGAHVWAANEQKVAFAKHYGIDGVMINGVLADTFLAIAE